MQITVKQYNVVESNNCCNVCKTMKQCYYAEVVATAGYKEIKAQAVICKQCLDIEKDRVFILHTLLMPKVIEGSQSSVLIPNSNHNR